MSARKHQEREDGSHLIVYVVGAGASRAISDAYPLGRDLVRKYTDDATKLCVAFDDATQHEDPVEAAESAVQRVRIDWASNLDRRLNPTDLIEFAREVVAYGFESRPSASIDDLLTKLGPESGASKAGRRALGMSILNAMADHHRSIYGQCMPGSQMEAEEPSIVAQDWNWLKPVAERIYSDLSADRPFWQHAFVTFNYDRTIEYYLSNYLGERWGQNAKEVYEHKLLSECPVTHAHGAFYGRYYDDFPRRMYPADEYDDLMEDAMVLVGEGEQEFRDTSGVPELLAQADRVVFLGFAYAPQNLRRIAPESFTGKVDLAGTMYKEPPARRGEIIRGVEQSFGTAEPIRLGDPDDTCTDCLKKFDVWAPPPC